MYKDRIHENGSERLNIQIVRSDLEIQRYQNLTEWNLGVPWIAYRGGFNIEKVKDLSRAI